jgi:hypothetical protein
VFTFDKLVLESVKESLHKVLADSGILEEVAREIQPEIDRRTAQFRKDIQCREIELRFLRGHHGE